ncbi:ribonuclease HII, partial [mine drainage metagenome]
TLTDLAGYNIFYGTSPSALTQRIKVTNIGVTSYTVSGLTSGTWYFVVTSYTADGTESAPSNVVSTTIA